MVYMHSFRLGGHLIAMATHAASQHARAASYTSKKLL